MSKTRFTVCLFIIVFSIFSNQFIVDANQNSSEQSITLFIDLNGIPISDALNQSSPILYNQSAFQACITCVSQENYSVKIDEIKTTFIFSGIDIVNKKEAIGRSILPGNNLTFIQTWKINNKLFNQNIALISGIYQIRYDVSYTIDGESSIVSSPPFFIDFNVNPFRSVFGIVATISLISTSISALRLISNIKNSIPNEIKSSSDKTLFKPSAELRSYYTETGFSKIQSEFAKRFFSMASSQWRKDKCPQCGTEWVKGAEFCSNCGISIDDAESLHADNLKQKVLDVGQEVVESVDGLTLGEIIAKLGDNITPTSDILELLTFSGLAIAEPRLSKEWNKKTRSMVFTILQWILYTIFWINACGISTISLLYLGVAFASGILLPLIIRKIYSDRIKKQITMYWIGRGK